MDIRDTITEQFKQTISLTAGVLKEDLTDETVLLESGLDSLGFAILVTRLEETFGRDPFTMMDEPVYPHTFKEFVEVYEQYIK